LADEKRPNFFWDRLAEGRYLDGLGDRLLAMAFRAAMSSSVYPSGRAALRKWIVANKAGMSAVS
jgi:hypothetical protein